MKCALASVSCRSQAEKFLVALLWTAAVASLKAEISLSALRCIRSDDVIHIKPIISHY